MPKVTVIVPVYGVEKYIERCARSLFEQTLNDMEYIFVDDCTPDMSIKILECVLTEYPNKKERTKVIHHEVNMGLPAARHTGLKYAHGDYIAHCDSDDWVERTTYERLYQTAIITKSDIVVCDLMVTNDRDYKKQIPSCSSCRIDKFISDSLLNRVPWSLCNKLIRAKLYENIIFPQYSMAEDLATTTQLLCKAQRIEYIPEALYNYYQNNSSIIHVPSEDAVLKRYEGIVSNTKIALDVLKTSTYSSLVAKVEPYLLMNAAVPLYSLFDRKEYRKKWRLACPKLGVLYMLFTRFPLYSKYAYIKFTLRYYLKRV